MAEEHSPRTSRWLFVAILALVAVMGAVLVPSPSRAGERIGGEWLIGFRSDPLTSGDITLFYEDVCIASAVRDGPAFTLLMSCEELGFMELFGTVDPNGTFRAVGTTRKGTTVSRGTQLAMVQTIETASNSALTGAFAFATNPPVIEGRFEGSPNQEIRGLVRCVRVNVGPFGRRSRADSVDAALILQYDAGLRSDLPCRFLGDANLDGAVDALDSLAVLQFVTGLIDRYPPY